MRISEMEAHHDELSALESIVRTMMGNNEFPDLFSVCEESFQHILPAIRYRKKRSIEPETPELLAITVVAEYAPPLFEHDVIESLFNLVKSTRALATHENNYLQIAETAFEHEDVAWALWNHLERQPGLLQRSIHAELGIGQREADNVVKVWEQLGLVARRPEGGSYSLHLRSRLDDVAEGICPACGVRGKGRREQFFKPVQCRKCGAEGYYHIVYGDRQ